GQYDVSLLAAAPAARGHLNFVEPNIAANAAQFGVPLDEFRTFIALHEATHAFEFEAYPWLRDHFASAVGDALEQLAADSGGLGGRLRAAERGTRRPRGGAGGRDARTTRPLAGADDDACPARVIPPHPGADVAARGLL